MNKNKEKGYFCWYGMYWHKTYRLSLNVGLLSSGRCSGACTAVYLPVCGTDGKTYSNECRMKISACEKNDTITVSYNGECNGEIKVTANGT